ncbi:hypothetical protein ACFY1C_36480 [Streptomyces sp. NPDC001279]|uniref:hypothetical protein n=1 Tax=Streptomyces sp. NPDC001279 TaxID=3364556 RepID=UPI0036C39D98
MIAAANETVQGANVRALHVQAPAPRKAGSAAAAADPAPQPTTPAAPVERRTPPDGYRRAIEAHRQAARPSRGDPAIAEAVEQTAAMRELSRRAFLRARRHPRRCGGTRPVRQDQHLPYGLGGTKTGSGRP